MARIEPWATAHPDKVALHVAETGEAVTYGDLHDRATRYARWLIALGLQPGDGIAMLMENHTVFVEMVFAARRAGVYFTPISIHLSAREVAYVLVDCGAKVLIATAGVAELAAQLGDVIARREMRCFMVDGTAAGFASWEQAVAPHAAGAALPVRPVGRDMLYSSGTTGKPKGIWRPLTPFEKRMDDPPAAVVIRRAFSFSDDMVYLSPAPLYHAAPLGYVTRVLESGGSVVLMKKFDPVRALQSIERFKATHSQWVPTMFIRMLALPEADRTRHDLSSMRCAIHAAAPCPPDVKRRMIDWWGPLIYEYYSGSETIGTTVINSAEWLAHPGSVGRAVFGAVHILDGEGRDLAANQIGRIFFSGGPAFDYHNDAEKTRNARDGQGRATYGDLGHLDEEGYLYISGRRTDLILSGGVNIYPQEIENVLATFPGIADAAVIGVMHAEFGEEVKAVIELLPGQSGSEALASEIIAFCRANLSHLKCPRSVDFVASLPRLENGKLLKRLLRDRYEQGQSLIQIERDLKS
jgi:long-chain acyl-CoA synthetase